MSHCRRRPCSAASNGDPTSDAGIGTDPVLPGPVIVSGLRTVMLSAFVSERGGLLSVSFVSTAWTVKEYWPAVVGVPEMSPLEESMASPGGSWPETDHVLASGRFDVICKEYGAPTVEAGTPDCSGCKTSLRNLRVDLDDEPVVRGRLRAARVRVVLDGEVEGEAPCLRRRPADDRHLRLVELLRDAQAGWKGARGHRQDGTVRVLVVDEADLQRIRHAHLSRGARSRVVASGNPCGSGRSHRAPALETSVSDVATAKTSKRIRRLTPTGRAR